MRVTVKDGQAVSDNGTLRMAGDTFDVDDNLARKWLERQLVMPAREPKAKKTS